MKLKIIIKNLLYNFNLIFLINDDLGEVININNINKDYQIGTYNENNKYENNIKNDIHANFKYYYPEEFNNQMNDNNKYQNY